MPPIQSPAIHDESLFGRIAVYGNYIRPEQLEECLRIQREESPPRPLGEILIDRGYLDAEELRMILEIRRKKGRRTSRRSDAARELENQFGRLALAASMITIDDLEDAILEQQRLDGLNLHFRLGEILVTRGKMKPSDVLEILKRQGKRLLVCPVCDIHYNVKGFRNDKEYSCTRCAVKLLEPRHLDSVSADAYIEG
jgi:hypothetical protein